jgi:hypothetical protein
MRRGLRASARAIPAHAVRPDARGADELGGSPPVLVARQIDGIRQLPHERDHIGVVRETLAGRVDLEAEDRGSLRPVAEQTLGSRVEGSLPRQAWPEPETSAPIGGLPSR